MPRLYVCFCSICATQGGTDSKGNYLGVEFVGRDAYLSHRLKASHSSLPLRTPARVPQPDDYTQGMGNSREFDSIEDVISQFNKIDISDENEDREKTVKKEKNIASHRAMEMLTTFRNRISIGYSKLNELGRSPSNVTRVLQELEEETKTMRRKISFLRSTPTLDNIKREVIEALYHYEERMEALKVGISEEEPLEWNCGKSDVIASMRIVSNPFPRILV